tara:strand:- start:110 stop:2986 length:2877 start_codon:yes stop_codon:yes gene_type:complete
MNQINLDKIYTPNNIEKKWYSFWNANKYFSPKNYDKDQNNSYSIVIPPPNVTGVLHMGHAFQYTLMDILIRYNRMHGKNTLWQMGTDHAGIATQMVVERQLEKQNITKHDLGRDKFVEKIWEWKEKSQSTIKNQIKRLGASVDWDSERFTMDEGLSTAVTKVFVQLHREKLIYHGQKLVNWDPILKTAVSDLEVINEPIKGSLWHINYPIETLENNDKLEDIQFLTIATTRPETMLGDSAIAVNPKDERYQKFIGKNIILPLTNRKIPIIADEYVDIEFGSGVVKITPAHDFNDFEVGARHNLPLINILTPDAKIVNNVKDIPEKYHNLDRFDARKQILKDLEELNLLNKTEKHDLKVPKCDRTNAIIEPYLTKQWFMKTNEIAKSALDVVQNNNIKFTPHNWVNTYYSWLNDIQDWCISRQLWWGHRIPAWYEKNNKGSQQEKVYVGYNEQEVRDYYNLDNKIELIQDADVLDTWFSSALWPFSTMGWPENTDKMQTFYPTNALVTGFDIIFFWVARMIMMGLKFTNTIPFKDVYIHGLIRDSHGNKMSKSKGNVLDPLDLVDGISLEDLISKRTESMMQPALAEKIKKQTKQEYPEGIPSFGTDALRFTYCALASTGRDINFDLHRVTGYRNFCNKLWNAARFVFMNTENYSKENLKDLIHNYNSNTLTLTNNTDKAIYSLLQNTIKQSNEHIKNYRFDLLAQCLYEFTWHEYCDWYLEIAKTELNNSNTTSNRKAEIAFNLLNILNYILKLLHPIIPFITEEIWQNVKYKLNINFDSIMVSDYPIYNSNLYNKDAISNYDILKDIITAIRNIRSEMNVANNKNIDLYIKNLSDVQDNNLLNNFIIYISSLGKVNNINYINQNDQIPEKCSTKIVHNYELYIPLADLIDVTQESIRVNKEIIKITKDIEFLNKKLENPDFLKKAPKELVDKQLDKKLELQKNLEKLNNHLENIKNL